MEEGDAIEEGDGMEELGVEEHGEHADRIRGRGGPQLL